MTVKNILYITMSCLIEKKSLKLQLTKKFDLQKIEKVLLCTALTEKESNKLLKLYRAVKDSPDHTITFTYERKKEHGRFYATGKHKDYADCNLWRHVRAELADEFEMDIDIVNCAPTTLVAIFEKAGFSCEYLRAFVDNREWFNDDLDITQADIDSANKAEDNCHSKRDIAKRYFNAIINGGGVKTLWKTQNLAHNILRPDSDSEKLVKEIKSLIPALWKMQDYAEYKKLYPKGALHHLLTDIEREVVTDLIKIFQEETIEVCNYIYDGFHVVCEDKTRVENILKGYVNDYDLKFTIKDFPKKASELNLVCRTPEQIEKAKALLAVPIGESDMEIAELCWDIMGKRVKRIEGGVLFYDDLVKRWRTIDVSGKFVGVIIQKANAIKPIAMKGPESTDYKYLSNAKGFRAVREMMVCFLESVPIVDDAITEINKRSEGKIFFKDKWLDMKTRQTGDITIKTAGFWNINRICPDFSLYSDSHPDVKQLIARVLSCWTDEQREIFLQAKARALAGHIQDKNFYCFPASRNSGKGVCTRLDAYGLGTFPNGPCIEVSIPMNNDLEKGDAKSRGWIIDRNMHLARISNSNELGKDGGTVNGNVLKSLASGGDKLECRALYKNSMSIANNCTMFFAFNTHNNSGRMPTFKPADALIQAIVMPMNYSYTDRADKIELSPNKYKPKDHGLKDLIVERKANLGNAYIWLLLQQYKSQAVSRDKLPEELRELQDEHKEDIIDEKMILFEEHFILGDEFWCIAQDFRSKMGWSMKQSTTATRWVKLNLNLENPKIIQRKVDGVNEKGYWGFKLRETPTSPLSNDCLL
ncbi:MAG: hypothetical protein ACXAAH_08535 [Promethearchaeota archaeon]|jgi:hypothetical protein